MPNEVFWHKCVCSECEAFIETDNQPWCILHTPVSGPIVEGYSARAAVTVLAPYEIVTLLLNELIKQKRRDGQLTMPGMEELSLSTAIDMGKVWLEANISANL